VIHQNLDGIKQSQLAASSKNRLVDRVFGTEIGGVALDDSFAHVGYPRHDRVL
jgi:hypothetical protein